MTQTIRIRGMGAVSSCGIGAHALVRDLRALAPSAARLTTFPLPFNDDIKVNQFQGALPPDGEERVDAVIRLALDEALVEAGLTPDELRSSALILGSAGLICEAEALYRKQKALGITDPPPLAGRGTGRVASRFARRLKANGPALTITTACTSSANALLVAASMIRRNEVRRAIVLGVEMLNAFTLNGFYSMMLLSPDGCMPFDADRRGIRLGEACAALVLEGVSSPDAGDTVLCGWANNCDTHNVISTNLDGRLVHKVMETALDVAGIRASDIIAIKAHGTGSHDNDATEAAAMRLVFEEGTKGGGKVPPFTGLKGYIGHTLGACGAIETIAFFRSLKDGFIPATLGFKNADPAIGITPLTEPIAARRGHYMLNFFGFGGNNTSLVYRYV